MIKLEVNNWWMRRSKCLKHDLQSGDRQISKSEQCSRQLNKWRKKEISAKKTWQHSGYLTMMNHNNRWMQLSNNSPQRTVATRMTMRTKVKHLNQILEAVARMTLWTWVIRANTGLSLLNQSQKLQMRMTTPTEMLNLTKARQQKSFLWIIEEIFRIEALIFFRNCTYNSITLIVKKMQ